MSKLKFIYSNSILLNDKYYILWIIAVFIFIYISYVNNLQKLTGRKWDEDLLEVATTQLLDDFPLPPSAPGGMVEYRRTLTIRLIYLSYH